MVTRRPENTLWQLMRVVAFWVAVISVGYLVGHLIGYLLIRFL